MPRPKDTAEIAGRVITPAEDQSAVSAKTPAGRRWLGVFFRCCNAYGRLYRNDARRCYEGSCPRCRGPLRVPIGAGGTSRRFFEAS